MVVVVMVPMMVVVAIKFQSSLLNSIQQKAVRALGRVVVAVIVVVIAMIVVVLVVVTVTKFLHCNLLHKNT
jgi:hypothetical protein